MYHLLEITYASYTNIGLNIYWWPLIVLWAIMLSTNSLTKYKFLTITSLNKCLSAPHTAQDIVHIPYAYTHIEHIIHRHTHSQISTQSEWGVRWEKGHDDTNWTINVLRVNALTHSYVYYKLYSILIIIILYCSIISVLCECASSV